MVRRPTYGNTGTDGHVLVSVIMSPLPLLLRSVRQRPHELLVPVIEAPQLPRGGIVEERLRGGVLQLQGLRRARRGEDGFAHRIHRHRSSSTVSWWGVSSMVAARALARRICSKSCWRMSSRSRAMFTPQQSIMGLARRAR